MSYPYIKHKTQETRHNIHKTQRNKGQKYRNTKINKNYTDYEDCVSSIVKAHDNGK